MKKLHKFIERYLHSLKILHIFTHDNINFNIMCNSRQSAASNLSNEQLQVFLTSQLGDGHIHTTNSHSTYYVTNCKYEEYINYKIQLLGDFFKNKRKLEKNGFCQTPIWEMRSKSSDILVDIRNMSIKDILDHLTDLGIALWFYDDGSLHKTDLYYNLNTHKFSEEIHRELFVPYFKDKWGITITPTKEHKKDGREFWYCRIRKYEGAFTISEILRKYYVSCYDYKIISSETIQKWSKLQEELKSMGKDVYDFTPFQRGMMLKNISL